ncbi:MAG TPA: DUF5691 domain-containing protein [Thermomicrobiales bacterium]|jgi:hypothetical protein
MERLVDIALIGTGRTGDRQAATDTPTAALVAALPDLTSARKLLLAAGAQAIYTLAGQPLGPTHSPAAMAPPDRQPACSSGAAYLLDQLFTRDEGGVLAEALTRLQRAGFRLPHRLLVAALETGKRQTELRSLLAPTLDQRGRWLAAQNRDWQWVAEVSMADPGDLPVDAEARWQEGTAAQRLAILRRLRVHDPATARDWVAASWKGEKADFRAQALGILATALSLDDEPFLEAALDDRSQAVRSVAAELLMQRPDSALSTRMRGRADTLLAYTPHKRGLFRALTQALSGNAARGDLSVQLPGDLALDWQRDGIEPKPRTGLGKGAWWLLCVLGAVPPRHWTTRFTATPEELIAAATQQEWGREIIEGWSRAAIRVRDSAWAPPLWRYWVAGHQPQQQGTIAPTELLRGLIAIMPGDALAQIGSDLLNEATRTQNSLWIEVAPLLPTPWLPGWGRQYLEISRARLKALRPQQYDPWIKTFDTAAHALPVESFPQALQEWPIPMEQSWVAMEWRRATDTITRTVALRQRLMKEIPL